VVSGTHYARTLRAWLDRLDAAVTARSSCSKTPTGPVRGTRWFHRWRLFDLACEELFAFRDGDEWHVSHYRFGGRPETDRPGRHWPS
jgi:cyclopropane-fatty-acyl-phospholipid synthase